MKRWIVITLAVVLAVPAALFTLVATEAGSRWLLEMASRASSERFSYQSVQGDLLSELQFSKLEVRAADHRAQAGRLIFRWRPLALLAGRLHVQRFSLTQVDYAAPDADPDTAPADAQPMDVSIPIAIQIDEFSVEDVLVRRDGERNRVDRVVMQGFSVDGKLLTMARLEVAADTLELTTHGHVDPSPPHAVEAGIAWTIKLPDGTRAEGVGNVTGTLAAIRIEHALTQPFAVDLSGTVAPLDDSPRLELTGQWKSLRWPLEGKPVFSSDTGTVTAKGNLRQIALSLDASINSDSIPARSLRIDADVRRPGKDVEASLRWSAMLADGKEAKGSGTFTGDARRINIDHALEKPVQFSTRGQVNLAANTPELSLDGEWRELSWPLAGGPTLISDSGRYRVSGVLNALRFQLDAALRSKAAQIEQLDLTLEGDASAAAPFPFDAKLSFEAKLPQEILGTGRARIQGDAGKINIDGSLVQPVKLKARGEIALAGAGPEIDFSGDWQDLRWPLSGEVEFESAKGSFTLSGPLEQLALKLEGKSSGRNIPTADTRLEARVRPEGARIDALSVETLGGEIRASGDVGWQPAPRWNLQVSASRLKPELYFRQWPGVISLETGISGRVDAGTPKLSIERLKLEGRLRGYPVKGSGAISVDGTTVSARNLSFQSGDNQVEVDGDADDRLNLSFVIDAPALNALAPDLEGSLKGEGRLGGNRSQPQVTAKISGSNLAWRNRGVDRLALDLDAGTKPGYRSRVVLDADGIRAEGRRFGKASLSGDGTPEQHRLVLTASGERGSLLAEATGRYQAGAWSGTLESAIKSKDFGDWRSFQPAAISARPDRIRLERLCLVQTPGRVCAGGSWQAEGDTIEASGEIANLPLALARPFLPQGVGVEGPLNGDFKAGGTVAAPQADIRFAVDTGTIFYQPGAGFESGQFDYRDGRVDVSYAPAGARLQMGLNLDKAGSVRGSIETGALSNDTPVPLKGRVEADFSDLGWLGVMLPQLAGVRGGLNAALDISGTTTMPVVVGQVALKNGQANVPDLGLELRQINLAMRSDKDERIVLEGTLGSGSGRLEITGRSKLSPAGERRVDMEFKGNDFEVAKLPTVQAYVSPDLRLSADPKLAELTGGVHIPRARVKLKQLPVSAVKVSEDEVIVNAKQGLLSQKKRPGPSLRIKVDLSLGDGVSLEGFGLTTRIDGNLAVSGETGKPPQAQGTLSLREGRYNAYGQDLKIQSGRLLFAGPIDNPGIDVTAVRELKDVTAGIVVGGSVKSIDSRVFSEPPLPQAEALSYLLTGRSLSGGTQSDAAELQRAAVALGLNQSNAITQQIQNMVGLDELSVGGDGVDQTSLLLGKQITPDIFIRYALGVFDQSGKLLLDYRLTDSISVQAESGEQQGMDIIYKIEREKLF